MLIGSVVLYLLLTIAIGLWAARRVHNAKDYVVAGRSLPLYMSAATVFATWFGAETVLSVSATFARDGLGGLARALERLAEENARRNRLLAALLALLAAALALLAASLF